MTHVGLQIFRTGDLDELGMSRHALRSALQEGLLVRHSPGLFYVPLATDDGRQRWRQRVLLHTLALRPNAVLARASAATARRLDGFDEPGPLIECNLPLRTGGARAAGGIRRTTPLEPPDEVDGLPVTGIGQTLIELGSTITASPLPIDERVELALECALHRRLLTLEPLADLLATTRNRQGIGVLRAVLRRRPPGAPPTESYLETRMVQLLRHHRLPEPERQVTLFDRRGRIGRVDLVIGSVVIELDGRETHDRSESFERDRLRWDRVQAAGYRLLTFTHHQVERERATVAAIVRDTLARAA